MVYQRYTSTCYSQLTDGKIGLRARLGSMMAKSRSEDSVLTGVSVKYADRLQPAKIKMTRTARAVARSKLRNDGEATAPRPSIKKRIRPSDPKQNNPNDVGAVIIPPGQGVM